MTSLSSLGASHVGALVSCTGTRFGHERRTPWCVGSSSMFWFHMGPSMSSACLDSRWASAWVVLYLRCPRGLVGFGDERSDYPEACTRVFPSPLFRLAEESSKRFAIQYLSDYPEACTREFPSPLFRLTEEPSKVFCDPVQFLNTYFFISKSVYLDQL